MAGENYRQLDPLAQTNGVIDPETDEVIEETQPYFLDADFWFGVKPLIAIDAQAELKQSQLQLDELEEDNAAEHRAVLKRAEFAIRSIDGQALSTFQIVRRLVENKIGVSEYFLRMSKTLLDASAELRRIQYIPDIHTDFGLIKAVLSGLYPDRLQGKGQAEEVPTSEESSVRFWPVASYMDEAFGDLRIAMNRIVYLGPLRAPAKRYYPIQSDANLQNDVTGEFLPNLLRERINTPVFSAKPVSHAAGRVRLAEALNSWLYFLRTGDPEPISPFEREIKVESMQDVLVELGIRSAGGTETHALADSGFGYSQLLPILVRGLMLPTTGTLIVEQPELHLNPALQVRLADFLVAMAALGKQIIVETHSEHIVNAIRAISAEKDELESSTRCTVLYLEAVAGRPQLHKLSMLSDGTVPDWPPSFFGEAAQLYGRILRAKRR